MHNTVLISVVKSRTPGCCHFEFKITQTSVSLDFLKTVPGGKRNLKVHKNQCFMNNQLQCGKSQPIFTEATGCTTLQ